MDRLRLRTCTVNLRALRVVGDDGTIVALSTKEAELLQILARRPGRAVPRETLYAEVWGYSAAVVSRALDTTVRRLRQKIEADPTDPQHLLTAHGEGYRFEPEHGPNAQRANGFVIAIGLVATTAGEPWANHVAQLLPPSGGVALRQEGDEHLVSFASAARAAEFCLIAVDGGGAAARGAGCAVPPEGDGEARVRRLLAATGAGRVVFASDLYTEVVASTGVRERPWRALGGVRLSMDELPERLYETGGAGSDPGLRPADGNLMPPTAPIVGRVAERARILDLLRDQRLVTITGTGGVGKTRLARDVGHTWRSSGGEAWFCDLSGCRTAREVTVAVTRALGIPLGPHTEPVHALEAIPHDLVVLDNAEQILAVVRDQVGQWCREERGAKILVTSRERIGAPAERVVELEPLSLDDGVLLFRERAGSIGVTVDDSPAVRALVARVEGLPLAIELAAARTELLSPEELLGRLEQSLGAIGTDPGRNARHTDLEATVRWSWDLLDPEERRVLVACAVFARPFAADDAEAVAGGDRVLDALHGLRRKGLLRPANTRSGERRHAPYAAVHAFTVANAEPEELDAARDRHARWYARWGSRELLDDCERNETLFRRLVDDLPELLAAIDHTIDRAPDLAVEASVGAAVVLSTFGPAEALERLAERVIPLSRDPRFQCSRAYIGCTLEISREVDAALRGETGARALVVRSVCAVHLGDLKRGWTTLVDASVAARREADGLAQGHVLEVFCLLASELGWWAVSREARRERAALYRRLGYRALECRSRISLCHVATQHGELDEALREVSEALEISAGFLDPKPRIEALAQLSDVHRLRGESGPAIGRSLEVIAELRRMGPHPILAGLWIHLGHCHAVFTGVAEARATYLEALRLHPLLESRPHHRETALGALARLDLAEGRTDDAIRALNSVVQAFEDGGTTPRAGWHLRIRGAAHLARGEPARAMVDLDRVVEMVTIRPAVRLEGLARASRAVARIRLGDREGAEQDWACAAARIARSGPGLDAAELAVLGADLAIARGDPNIARAAVNRARRTLAGHEMGETTLLGLELRRIATQLDQDAPGPSSRPS